MDLRERRARTSWDRALNVALVLVQEGPVSPEAIQGVNDRLLALEQQLSSEMHRYRTAPATAVHIFLRGPVPAPAPFPVLRSSDVLDLIRFNYELWRFSHAVDALANVRPSSFDSRVYLVVREPASAGHQFVEGLSQSGGRIGAVSVEFDKDMVDFTLFVAVHELLHTLGASDKYTPQGAVMVPDGLGEPTLEPRYPQHYAEVMARHVALTATADAPPDSLDQLRIGEATAREIGWLR